MKDRLGGRPYASGSHVDDAGGKLKPLLRRARPSIVFAERRMRSAITVPTASPRVPTAASTKPNEADDA
jgi:hypothetical protein